MSIEFSSGRLAGLRGPPEGPPPRGPPQFGRPPVDWVEVRDLYLKSLDDLDAVIWNVCPTLFKLAAPQDLGIFENTQRLWKESESSLKDAAKEISPDKELGLEQVGLTGPQLERKKTSFEMKHKRFWEFWNGLKGINNVIRDKLPIILKLLKMLLSNINNFLDSLAAVIPLVHAAKEVKGDLDSDIEIL